MTRLSHHQYDNLLKAIGQLHACRSLADFPALVNSVFPRLVAVDSVSYNEVYPAIDRTVAQMFPEPEGMDTLMASWKQFAHQHPVLAMETETDRPTRSRIF